MSKIKIKAGKVKRISQLTVINTKVAGIDVSDSEMKVAFPIDSEQVEVRPFGTFTRDLQDIAKCFTEFGITSVAMKSMGVYWVQKALELMNIKLHTIISDIDGKTGRLIIEAILAGERNPEVLADMRDRGIKASREDIIKWQWMVELK